MQGFTCSFLTILVVLAGCSPQANVRSQTTPGTDFRKYHSYAIKPGTIAILQCELPSE